MERAAAFGIESVERLDLESKPWSPRNKFSRLVELPQYRTNAELWCLLLDYRRDRDGRRGVEKVFQELATLCPDDFPCKGPSADHLWHEFVIAGAQNASFLTQICNRELRVGAPREHFVLEVCTELLKGSRASSLGDSSIEYFGKRLLAYHELTDEDLFQLFRVANDLDSNAWPHCIHNMKDLFQEHSVYDRIIEYLTGNDQLARAWIMHHFLLSIGDLPKKFDTLLPLIKELAIVNRNVKLFIDSLKFRGASFENQIQVALENELSRRTGFSTTNLNIVSSRTLGVKPSKMSDDFAARAFATSSFSFDFMLNALRLLGLVAIGPVPVRQLALGGLQAQEVGRRLTKLQEAGVDSGSSAYVRLVKYLIEQNKEEQLTTLLESDQHPEVFDDLTTQKKLLTHFLSVGGRPAVDLAMSLLQLHHSSNHLVDDPLNILLRCAIKAQDVATVCSVWKIVRSGRLEISQHSLWNIRVHLLPILRLKDMQHSSEDIQALKFAVSVAQNVKSPAKHQEFRILKEAMVRFGAFGEYEHASKIVLFLATRLSQQGPSSKPLLREIFAPITQRALVAWSFYDGIFREPDSEIGDELGPASESNDRADESLNLRLRGCRLLRCLAQEYNVEVNFFDVERAFVLCLRNLFSQGISDLLGRRVTRLQNQSSLAEYLVNFYRIWDHRPTSQEMAKTIEEVLFTVPDSMTSTPQQIHGRPPLSMEGGSTQTAEDDVVAYRDLFNPSWEEYEEVQTKQGTR